MSIFNYELTHPNPLLKKEGIFPFSVKRRGKGMSYNQSGIALIIVVSIMAVLASIAAAFSYSMIMDQRAAANYMTGIKADYVARAGIQHAIGVLKMDGDPSNQPPAFCSYEGYDWYGDDWGYDSTLFGGDTSGDDSNIDNDSSTLTQTASCGSGMDSRWIYMHDSQGNLIGRYAVLVIDESGKMNINTAGSTSYGLHGWTTKEIRLDPDGGGILFSTADANAILDARYGTDGSAGVSGVGDAIDDDNADSVVLNNDGIDNDGVSGADNSKEGIDDPAEFYISRPYTTSGGLSADTPFVTVGEIVSLAGLSGNDYNDSSHYLTAFSSDKNLTDSGLARLNINAVSDARELYLVLRDVFNTSVTNSELAQMAVNIIDYRDRDNGSTRIDVREITRYGVEGIRINEVMVRPVFRKTATTDITEECKTVGGWSGTPTFTSSTAADSGIWNWAGIPKGTYKVLLYGDTSASGTKVKWLTYSYTDNVWEDTREADLPYTDGDDTVVITNTGTFRINIQAKAIGNHWSHVELSQSPDCEYVEIVNISPNSIDMSGWHVEFPNGQVGTISSGEIVSGDTVVLAIDKNDTYDNAGIWKNNAANGISIQQAVTDELFNPLIDMDKVWQLTFTNTILEDIISDTVLMDSPLRLYDGPIAPTTSPTGPSSPAGHIVDQVLWDSHVIQECEFYSMERDDPTFMGTDAATNIDVLNDSGIFDSWLIYKDSSHRGTPTKANSNKTAGKTLGIDVKVKNSPFANIGEIADVSDTAAWENIGDSTKEYKIKAIADKITVSARRLDAEFGDHTWVGSANWNASEAMSADEIKRKFGKEQALVGADKFIGDLYWFNAKSGRDEDDEDTWTWYTTIDRFEADTYIMYVYGREGGRMRVRVGNDSAIIVPSSDYGARFGRVVISDTTLEVAVSPEDSNSDSTYFDYVLLTPASKTYGRLNINTASSTVLQGLQGIGNDRAQDIVDKRNSLTPKAFKSIGEILDVDYISVLSTATSSFQFISNLITTKSNVFKIICTGQSILDKNGDGTFDTDDEVLGERKITVIYER